MQLELNVQICFLINLANTSGIELKLLSSTASFRFRAQVNYYDASNVYWHINFNELA